MFSRVGLLSENFKCSVCQQVFTLPVKLPCGDNVCRSCMDRHWEDNIQYDCCPICGHSFDQIPALRTNLSSSSSTSSSQQQAAGPGDVCCDQCSGIRMKAVKSCLVCLISYCETHLKEHIVLFGLIGHQLVDPVKNLQRRTCQKHHKPLEMYCRTDSIAVCQLCPHMEHKSHLLVSLEDEYSRRKSMLSTRDGKIHQMIQERRQKVQELTSSARLNQEAADRAMTASVQVLTALSQILEKHLSDLIQTLEEKLRTSQQQHDCFLTELHQEISQLTRTSSEVQQLSRTEDQFKLLQDFSTLITALPTKDWTEVRVQQPLYEQMARTAVQRAVDLLQKDFRTEKKKLLEEELKRARQDVVELTLDPQTASPWLVLSADGKRVSLGDTKKTLTNTPERFSPGGGVLAKQSFSSGRFYYEVQMEGKTQWDLGVVQESIRRKGKITQNMKGDFWIMSLRKGKELSVRDGEDRPLGVTWIPQKLGVFVDYDDGLVSFYDAEAADLLYSFTGCRFTDRLVPFFCPGHAGLSSRPLIITPVIHH